MKEKQRFTVLFLFNFTSNSNFSYMRSNDSMYIFFSKIAMTRNWTNQILLILCDKWQCLKNAASNIKERMNIKVTQNNYPDNYYHRPVSSWFIWNALSW